MLASDMVNEGENTSNRFQNKSKRNLDDEEQNKSQYTEYYTPPNNPSDIPHSYLEDSFTLDLQLNAQQ